MSNSLNWQRWSAATTGFGVRRYHNKRPLHPQDVGQHTARMLALLVIMFGNECSQALLKAVLVHDLAEGKYGDVPSPTKRMIPTLKAELDKLENEFLEGLDLEYESILGERERRWLKLVDYLEGYLYSDEEVALGNTAFAPTRARFAEYINGLALTAKEAMAVLSVLPPNHHGPLAPGGQK